MKIDPDKIETNEDKSNPMVVAMQYKDCPINEPCFFLVVGFGKLVKQCNFFQPDKNKPEAECTYMDDVGKMEEDSP